MRFKGTAIFSRAIEDGTGAKLGFSIGDPFSQTQSFNLPFLIKFHLWHKVSWDLDQKSANFFSVQGQIVSILGVSS